MVPMQFPDTDGTLHQNFIPLWKTFLNQYYAASIEIYAENVPSNDTTKTCFSRTILPFITLICVGISGQKPWLVHTLHTPQIKLHDKCHCCNRQHDHLTRLLLSSNEGEEKKYDTKYLPLWSSTSIQNIFLFSVLFNETSYEVNFWETKDEEDIKQGDIRETSKSTCSLPIFHFSNINCTVISCLFVMKTTWIYIPVDWCPIIYYHIRNTQWGYQTLKQERTLITLAL
jgi:hypothetical protein